MTSLSICWAVTCCNMLWPVVSGCDPNTTAGGRNRGSANTCVASFARSSPADRDGSIFARTANLMQCALCQGPTSWAWWWCAYKTGNILIIAAMEVYIYTYTYIHIYIYTYIYIHIYICVNIYYMYMDYMFRNALMKILMFTFSHSEVWQRWCGWLHLEHPTAEMEFEVEDWENCTTIGRSNRGSAFSGSLNEKGEKADFLQEERIKNKEKKGRHQTHWKCGKWELMRFFNL